KNDDRHLFRIRVLSLIRLGRTVESTLLSKDRLPALEERLCYTKCLPDKATAVVLKIKDKLLHAAFFQELHRFSKLAVGRLIKTTCHRDVTDPRTNHVSLRDRRLRHGVPND